jgi:biopolymer transport protein ExbD
MNFQRGRSREDPEMNLVPLIDVLMVILIFLMVTTTYAKFAELQINLPEASGEPNIEKPAVINVAVDAAGRYVINDTGTNYASPESFADALKRASGGAKEPVININADAAATHQSVINIMEAARIAGYTHITFTTQAKPAQ